MRRAQAQARDGVGDRDLRHALALVLGANRVLGRRAARDARCVVDRGADRRQPQAVLAHAVQQLHDERDVEAGGQRAGASAASPSIGDEVGVGGQARARATSISSASRRRFSMSASFSMLGHAHSSPMVSGATRW